MTLSDQARLNRSSVAVQGRSNRIVVARTPRGEEIETFLEVSAGASWSPPPATDLLLLLARGREWNFADNYLREIEELAAEPQDVSDCG